MLAAYFANTRRAESLRFPIRGEVVYEGVQFGYGSERVVLREDT